MKSLIIATVMLLAGFAHANEDVIRTLNCQSQTEDIQVKIEVYNSEPTTIKWAVTWDNQPFDSYMGFIYEAAQDFSTFGSYDQGSEIEFNSNHLILSLEDNDGNLIDHTLYCK